MKNDIPSNQPKQAVIYCRVSTKEQVDEGNSLVSQERLCREYALKEGYVIAEIFIEKGESAKTADRKELKRMMEYCRAKKGRIQVVIAYKVDRVSRNIADYSLIKTQLQKVNVTIRSVTEFFEDTPAGRFMESIIANVGQFDNEVRIERSIGGMKQATEEGRYVWAAPLGYSNVKINGLSTIAPNDKASLIREVFERIAQRTDATDIIRVKMEQKGLCSRRGTAVPRSHFFRLIRNPLYKGTIKKFGKLYEGTFEPIVSAALFDKAQEVISGRKHQVKQYRHEHPDFPLRRFVVNEFGKQLTGYWSKGKRLKYPYYSFTLPGTSIRKEVLEQKFIDFLSRFEYDVKDFNALRKNLIKYVENDLHKGKSEKETMEKRVIEINAQIDNLIKLEATGSISTSLFIDRTKGLEAEQNNLRELLEEQLNDDIDISELLAFSAAALKKPFLLWQLSPVHIQRKLQVFDFPEGIIFDGVNFRTPKVCSIFKAKEVITTLKLSRGSSEGTKKNTVHGTKLPPSEINPLDTKAFWKTVAYDLRELKNILGQNSSTGQIENENDMSSDWLNGAG